MNRERTQKLWYDHVNEHNCMDCWVAKDIVIVEVIPRPLFWISLQTWVEQESLSWAYENITEEQLLNFRPKSTIPSTDPSPMVEEAIKHARPSPFEDAQISLRIEESDHIRDCIMCKGSAVQVCTYCKGLGRVPCECTYGKEDTSLLWKYAHLELFQNNEECPKCSKERMVTCQHCEGMGDFGCKVCLTTGKIRGFCMKRVEWKTLQRDIYLHLEFPMDDGVNEEKGIVRRLQILHGSNTSDILNKLPPGADEHIASFLESPGKTLTQEEAPLLSHFSPESIHLPKETHLQPQLAQITTQSIAKISQKMHRQTRKDAQFKHQTIKYQQQILKCLPMHQVNFSVSKNCDVPEDSFQLSTHSLRNVSVAAFGRPPMFLNMNHSSMRKRHGSPEETFWIIGSEQIQILCPFFRVPRRLQMPSTPMDEPCNPMPDFKRANSDSKVPLLRRDTSGESHKYAQRQTSRAYMPSHISKANQIDECIIS